MSWQLFSITLSKKRKRQEKRIKEKEMGEGEGRKGIIFKNLCILKEVLEVLSFWLFGSLDSILIQQY